MIFIFFSDPSRGVEPITEATMTDVYAESSTGIVQNTEEKKKKKKEKVFGINTFISQSCLSMYFFFLSFRRVRNKGTCFPVDRNS